jgi:hypothetical protein
MGKVPPATDIFCLFWAVTAAGQARERHHLAEPVSYALTFTGSKAAAAPGAGRDMRSFRCRHRKGCQRNRTRRHLDGPLQKSMRRGAPA